MSTPHRFTSPTVEALPRNVLELAETTVLELLLAYEEGSADRSGESVICRLMEEAADALTYVHSKVRDEMNACLRVSVCTLVVRVPQSVGGL